MLRFKKYSPAYKLADYVHYYFVIEKGVDLANIPTGDDEFLSNHPQGTFDLMFALNGGINLVNHKDDQFELSKMFVMAQQEGYFKIKFEPDSHIFGVVFFAESFSKLFNFPKDELVNGGMRVDEYLSESYQRIFETLSNSNSDGQKVRSMDVFLEEQLGHVDFSFTKFDHLIRSIRLGTGTNSIEELSNDSNMSKRSLQRKMKNEIGIGPKSFSKVIRFKEVLRYINEHPEYDWQDVLFNCGYYDQAHFIKDFKKFTGKTPTSYLNDQNDLSNLFLEE